MMMSAFLEQVSGVTAFMNSGLFQVDSDLDEYLKSGRKGKFEDQSLNIMNNLPVLSCLFLAIEILHKCFVLYYWFKKKLWSKNFEYYHHLGDLEKQKVLEIKRWLK